MKQLLFSAFALPLLGASALAGSASLQGSILDTNVPSSTRWQDGDYFFGGLGWGTRAPRRQRRDLRQLLRGQPRGQRERRQKERLQLRR